MLVYRLKLTLASQNLQSLCWLPQILTHHDFQFDSIHQADSIECNINTLHTVDDLVLHGMDCSQLLRRQVLRGGRNCLTVVGLDERIQVNLAVGSLIDHCVRVYLFDALAQEFNHQRSFRLRHEIYLVDEDPVCVDELSDQKLVFREGIFR